jgi:GT2 family glycosyltransferase
MLSVCIVNWNTKVYLRECLASLTAYPPPDSEGMEIVVVDNASSDDSAQMVAEEFPDVLLICASENLGYAEANNVALRRAVGDLLLLLNPDVRVDEHTLTRAIAFTRERRDAGAVSILFRNPDGSIQPSLRGFPSPEALLWEVTGIRRILPGSRRFGAYFMSWFNYDSVTEADQPMGTFLMIPRAAYETVGELDTDFPIFFNEVDWCYRAKQRGWRIYFTPDAEIVHYGGRGTDNAPKASMIRESHRSLQMFYDKHYRQSLGNGVYTIVSAAIKVVCAARVLRASK